MVFVENFMYIAPVVSQTEKQTLRLKKKVILLMVLFNDTVSSSDYTGPRSDGTLELRARTSFIRAAMLVLLTIADLKM